MNIRPEEIESVEDAGKLFNEDVKLIKTKGGFWVALGKKSKNSKMESLAMGSHKALVTYQIEKQYKSYQPLMMKSEQSFKVLDLDSVRSGMDHISISALKDNNIVSVHLFKHDKEVAVCTFITSEDSLSLNSVNGSEPELIKPYLPDIIKELVK